MFYNLSSTILGQSCNVVSGNQGIDPFSEYKFTFSDISELPEQNLNKRSFSRLNEGLEEIEAIKRVRFQKVIDSSTDVSATKIIDSEKFFIELAEKYIAKELLPFSPLCCRFKDISCPTWTHVEVVGETRNLYLHANHVNLGGRHFIATQYPMVNETSNLKIGKNFWIMSRDSGLIIDLTNDQDLKKGLEPYAPEFEETLEFSDLCVECTKEEEIDRLSATLYTYTLEEGFDEDKNTSVRRLNVKEWLDHEGIEIESFDRLVDFVLAEQKNPDDPVVVHCRAGAGRTGTLITACALKPMIQSGKITSKNLKEKMGEIILQGRAQRGKYFVQSLPQLTLLCEWAQNQLNVKL